MKKLVITLMLMVNNGSASTMKKLHTLVSLLPVTPAPWHYNVLVEAVSNGTATLTYSMSC